MADENQKNEISGPEDVATESIDDVRKGCFGSVAIIFTLIAATAYFGLLVFIILF
jgi:hypothetical protein